MALQRIFVLQKSEITMEVGVWVQVSLGIFCVENRPKIALNQYILIFWSIIPSTMCILSVYALLKCVRYYDLSVLCISVMGFQKSLDGGGWVG